MADGHIITLQSEIHEKIQELRLGDITTITLNTEVLQHNFEVLIEILKKLVVKVDHNHDDLNGAQGEIKDLKDRLEKLEKKEEKDRQDLDSKINDTNSNLDKVKDNTDKNTDNIDKIFDELKKLKDKQNDLQNLNDNLQNDMDKVKDKLALHDKQISDLFNNLGKETGNTGDSIPSGALDNLRNEFENLKNDIYDRLNQFVNKDDFNKLKDDLDNLRKKFEEEMDELRKLLDQFVKKPDFEAYQDLTNNKLQSHDNSIEDIYKILDELRGKIGNKLDCDTYDEHLIDYNNLKNIVLSLVNKEGGNIPTQVIQQGPSLSTKDANLLKELGLKFPELEALVKKLQKDLTDHILGYNSFADQTNKKIAAEEENLKHLKTDTNRRIKELEELIKALKEQINNLKIVSNGGVSCKTSGDYSFDIQELRNLINNINLRLDDHEKNIGDALSLSKDNKSKIDSLDKTVTNVQDLANDNRNKINNLEEDLNAEIKAIKLRLDLLEQLMKDNKSKPHTRKPSMDLSNVGGVTLDQVKQIVDEEINKLRDEILALLEDLKNLLDKKADADDLWKSEAALLEKLDQVAGALMKRAQADKNDMKKALMFLEKKIKEMTLYLFGDPSQGEDGAILVKKPWTPWSCASCDNKLNHYPGPLIDHKNWNKLPQRTASPERMTQGKFGKGWNKWADTKKTTIEKMRDSQTAHGMRSTFESLPEIHKDHSRAHLDPLSKGE